MKRKILRGLSVEEFIHPHEKANKARALSNDLLNNALNSAADFCHVAIESVTQGTFVQMNEQFASKLIKVVREVCTILEVAPVPETYVCHNFSTNIMPLGTDDKSYLVVPDYVLNSFDIDMLFYSIGNAITMIKADHVGLTTLAAYMPGGGLVELPKMLFNKYLHSADSTSDRGGLLTCQSWAAAARCHMFELGIPPKISRELFTTNEEAELFTENYIAEQERTMNGYSPLLIWAAREYQRLSYIEASPTLMLRELFDWYRDSTGYRAIMRKHGSEYIGEDECHGV